MGVRPVGDEHVEGVHDRVRHVAVQVEARRDHRLAADDRSGALRGWETVDTAVVAGTAAALVLGAIATAVPMVSGLRAFRRLEP